jgi:hypothetical protein
MKFTLPKFLSLVFISIIYFSCQSNNFNKEDLQGTWKVVNWEIEKTGQKRTNKMDMTFAEDSRYSVDYGSEKEMGEYWIANGFLHTHEDEQEEKKVRILKLTQDTFHMQMNRGGSLENVLLIKK